nr:RNA-directed DNA polymerase, eukaryota, reverse transcriptase zinc-binding domain protein [Tanacetum cinerariifolium]
MEGLHVAIEDAIAAGLYRGLKVRNISLSHLFFANDALFIGDWSIENIFSLVSILESFHKVSGLKLNFHKSNLFGIGVNFNDARRAATITGSSMLSIGGRATLVSLVLGSLGTYYLSFFPLPITVCKKLESIRARFFWGSDGSTKKLHWIAWNSVTASKRNGGLGIGSLFSLNHALIQKWRWRFVNHPQSLWVRLITAIHGGVQNVTTFFKNISSQSVWGRIVGSINTMHEKCFIPLSTLSRRVNNGADTKFWWNLSRKGMDVDSILCPACNTGAETTIHTLWFCSLATTVWIHIFVWIQIPPPSPTNIQDLFSWVDALHLSAFKKSIADSICGVVLWSLWSFRNESIFGSSMPKRSTIIDKIIDLLFRWYTSRNKLASISWNNWIQNPLEDFSL